MAAMICEECKGTSDFPNETDFRLTGREINLYFCCLRCLAIWSIEQLADRTELTK